MEEKTIVNEVKSNPLLACKIYTDGKFESLEDALKTMTEEWVDYGEYSDQTVHDLISALHVAVKANDKVSLRGSQKGSV